MLEFQDGSLSVVPLLASYLKITDLAVPQVYSGGAQVSGDRKFGKFGNCHTRFESYKI